ncbi:LPS-assembly protein LptD, partial [Selenomonadales bacterium OttesenSCG-928-I06]|nr:LPS-assembly protein LptD [Selenomonadales bacterium OttesenSCG-928-I06]
EQVIFTAPNANITTSNIFYNYNEGTGVLAETKGRVDKYFIQGKRIEIFPDKYVIYEGMATRCPAKEPDYKLTADRIEIYPDDKMVAYDVDFWIKNHILYSMRKHQSTIREKSDDFSLPKVGRSNNLGFYIKQKLEYPITSDTTARADINYYSKHGFKPGLKIEHSERWYNISVGTGYYTDWDDRWIKKSPEFKLDFHQRKIGRSPLNYSFSASYGKWKDDYFSSWHGQYLLYINHDPIKISNSTRLYLGTGIEWITETYDHSHQSAPRFDATITKSFSDRFNTFVSYNYRDYGNKALFEFDTPDAEQQLTYGFSYKLDSKNTIGIAFKYDLDNDTHKDLNYYYYRDLHCWETLFMYKAKEKSFEWHLTVKRW